MAGKYTIEENVIAYNNELFEEINKVVGYPPMTFELMKIAIGRQIRSFSTRKCDINKKRFFEACLNKL